MHSTKLLPGIQSLLFAVLLLVAILGVPEKAHAANQVYIDDQAGVLNVSQVNEGATSFPYELGIYTTRSFQGDAGQLAYTARQHIYTTHSALIVIEIDVVQHHIAIVGNSGANLTDQQYHNGIVAFATTFHQGQSYTVATLAVLHSLSGSSGNNTLITWIVIGGFLLLILVLTLCLGGGNSSGGGSSHTTYYSSPSGSSGGDGGGAIGNF